MAKPQSQKTDTMPVDTLVYFRRVCLGGKEGGGKKPCGTAAILLLRLLLISRSLKSRTFFLELSCVFAAASLVTSDSKHNFQRSRKVVHISLSQTPRADEEKVTKSRYVVEFRWRL